MLSRRKRRQARAERDASSLGNILTDLGYCSRDSIRQALKRQGPVKLGRTLLDERIVTPEQLEHALMRQRVLRGREEPSKLKAYGPDGRRTALKQIAERLQAVADHAALLADKVSR